MGSSVKGFSVGDPRAVAAGKRAGVVSGERRRAQRERRWRALGIDPILAQDIRRLGYLAGWRQGYRAGLQRAGKAAR